MLVSPRFTSFFNYFEPVICRFAQESYFVNLKKIHKNYISVWGWRKRTRHCKSGIFSKRADYKLRQQTEQKKPIGKKFDVF